MKDESHGNFATIGTPVGGLTGATLGFFIGFAAVSLFGPTAKSLKGIMGLGPLEVGFLVAAPSLSGSLLRIPFSASLRPRDHGTLPVLPGVARLPFRKLRMEAETRDSLTWIKS